MQTPASQFSSRVMPWFRGAMTSLVLLSIAAAPPVVQAEPCDKACCLAVAVNEGVWTITLPYYYCHCEGGIPHTYVAFLEEVTYHFDVRSWTYACGEEWECTQVSTYPEAVIYCGEIEQMLHPRIGPDWIRAEGPKNQTICEQCYIPGVCFPSGPAWADLPHMCGICVCDDPCHCHVEWLTPLIYCPAR
ncbi:MAG: hypothetical protein GEEBNDBF_01370 [bacterium]|nr:hypothetical protein [bacterium]